MNDPNTDSITSDSGAAKSEPASWLRKIWTSNPGAAWSTFAMTTVGVVVAIYFGVQASRGSGPIDEPVSPTQLGSAVASATAERESGTPDSPDCIDAGSGSPVECSSRQASLVVHPEVCTTDALFELWGIDSELEALLISVYQSGDVCVATLGEEALSAGGRASDLEALAQQREINAALRECARVGGSARVSCVDLHEVEWVGQWREVTTEAASDVCLKAGQTYAGRSLVGSDPLTSQAIHAVQGEGAQVFRCGLTVSGSSLTSTVRAIGTKALPILVG